jgi:MFS family permease
MTMSKNSLTADLRALPRAFWVLVAGTFVNRFGSFVFTFLTLFLGRRGLSLWAIGAVMAGYGAGGLLASVSGGWFADRFGRRNTIVVGTWANAASVFALYFAATTPVLVLFTVLAGFFGGFYQPAAGALVSDVVPEHLRLAAFAVLRQAANAGFAFGTAAAGFLLSHSTFWLFAGDALTTAAYGFIALFMLPHGLRATSEQARWSEALVRLRHDGPFWALYAAQFLTGMIVAQFVSSYAREVTAREMHLGWLRPEQIFGTLIGWNGLLILLMELPLTRFTRQFAPRRVMCLGYVLIGIGFASNSLHLGFAALFAGMTVFTIGEMISMPMISSYVAFLAPESMRGRYIGALGTAWYGAGLFGPALGLQLHGYNPPMLWLGCGAMGFCSAFILARWGEGPSHSAVAQPLPAVLDGAE